MYGEREWIVINGTTEKKKWFYVKKNNIEKME